MEFPKENTELQYRSGSTEHEYHSTYTPAKYSEVTTWTNYYLCSCGEIWIDRWSACCNDRCPKCNTGIKPFISDDGTRSQDEIQAAHAKANFVCQTKHD